LSPRDEDILKNIGLIYIKTGKADLAQDYLLRASNLNPDKDEITLALGKAYFAAGKYQNALDCYLKIKDKVLDNKDIYYFIAMAYGKLQNRGESHYYFGLYFKKKEKEKAASSISRKHLIFSLRVPNETMPLPRKLKIWKTAKA